jgi:hypothetical protein
MFFVGAAKADDIAYMGENGGDFGTIDLKTGVFTSTGNSGTTLSGMAVADGNLFGANYHISTGTLYMINPTNGALTSIGNSSINIDDFGSTTTGLYAVGVNANLYSINPTTGAATLIGATGITFGTWRGLSTNASSLYFANGTNLYTLNTSTGAATLVGSMGTEEEGALLLEDGILYGGQDGGPGAYDVNTLSASTGAATAGPSLTGPYNAFYALAPYPLPSSPPPPGVPEPGSLTLLGGGLCGLAAVLKIRLR